MKKLLTLLVLMVGVNHLYAQNYDLIVKNNGDSIACRIDSITDFHIFLEMKVRHQWINTSMSRNEVVDYRYNAIDKKTVVFKLGTSYIESFRKEPATLWFIQRNTIAFETNIVINSIYYGRLFPLGNSAGITVGAGLNYFGFGVTFITLESTFLLGQTKHFFEPGLKYVYTEDNESGLLLSVGYRFQGLNGLLFKTYVGFAPYSDAEVRIVPMIGIGYSF